MKQKQLLKQILFEQQKTNELLQNLEIRHEHEMRIEIDGKLLEKELSELSRKTSRMKF